MNQNNLKKFIILLFLLLNFAFIEAQNNYFQQEVNYKINVELFDDIHFIKGNIEMEYINHSPDTLSEIFMHLWGNAFKNKNTAFSKQQLRVHNTKFYYADEQDNGYYEKLNFKVDGIEVNWAFEEGHIDIALLKLKTPLKPNQKIVISTPFELKIPASFSRLGHIETSYQMTQWYPKPAVYDKNGWHQMPYLNMGEFYSEFGNYDVEITLPSNYYVAATGTLQTESEKKFVEDRILFTTTYLEGSIFSFIDFPPSSESKKTIRYKAEKVHDFAWFADKRFLIKRDKANLSSGKEIECNVFFTDQERELWKEGAFYVKRAVEFYSARVGDYPYPQATAVQSALSAGAGMEYPMITVIGTSGNAPALDQVITHEVGHNWFYGILASNERDYAWMDEGMNSYHDHKYTDVYYEDYDELSGIMPKKIKKQLEYSSLSYAYQIFARLGKDQSPNTTSDDLTTVNYFLCAYEKPAMSFKLLEHYIGEQELIAAMHDYYAKWSFKHPQPEDTKASFEASTGKDLSWLFDGLMGSNATYDYGINSINKFANTIEIVNKGSVAPPLQITYHNADGTTFNEWEEGFIGKKQILLKDSNVKEIELDNNKISLDINPSNDTNKIDGSNIKPLAFRFISGLRTSKKNKIFMLPTLSGNISDGIQLGMAFHNYGIPLSTFQYYIQPAIGSKSEELVGTFEFRKDFPQKKSSLRNVSLALGGKSFHEHYNEMFDINLRFTRFQPSIELEWQEKLVSPQKHFLRYRTIFLIKDRPTIGRETGFEGLEHDLNIIHELGYELDRSSAINPYNIETKAEYQKYSNFGQEQQYLKLYGEIDSKYAYKKGKFFNFRAFLGFFPLNTERNKSTRSAQGNFAMFHGGSNDYKYDVNYIGRNSREGFSSRQIDWNDGGFKNGISNAYSLGLSNSYMASINLSLDLPFSWARLVPIKPYFDTGIYGYRPTSSEPMKRESIYSGGIMINFQKVVSIHVPLINSENISNIYGETTDNIWQRISFNIDINRLNPHKMKRWLTR